MQSEADEAEVVALRVRSLSKTYPGVRAMRDVALDVRPGSVHAILGHNGCGKSTLVKTLAGVQLPDPGAEVWIDGEPLQFGAPDDADRKGLRFVHQELGVIPELGAADNIGFVVGFERDRFGRIDWRRQERRTSELLARFGFDLDPRTPLREASPAQRTAVAIVRAVAGWEAGRGVLVLDEPTAALPAREVDVLFDLVRTIRDSGTAVILVSHRLDEVMSIADHATVMRAGQVIWTGAIADVLGARLVQLIADADEETADTGAVEPTQGLEAQDTALSITDVRGRYLDGVSLSVRAGEVVGVAGLLGSGREELPYVVAGAHTAGVSGSFTVGGTTTDRLDIATARRLGVALVPADRSHESVFSRFTTQENVSLAALPGIARRSMVRPAAERRFAREWLVAVDADPATAPRSITTLSGGNQQKAVLARWLSTDPRVLTLSEPTAGVDVGARAVIYQQLRERAAAGLAVLVSSSDPEDLLALSDRIVVLRDGRIAAELTGAQRTKRAIVAAMEGIHHAEQA